MANTGLPLRQRLDQRFTALKAERSPWEHEWRLVQKFVAPRRGRMNLTDRGSGREKHADIINNTASQALRTLTNGLAANLINPASPWFRLSPQNAELAEYGKVREWLDTVEQRIYQILLQSGFYQAATVAMGECAAFGSGALGSEPDFENVLRWQPWTIGQYYLANDRYGKATTIYREWQLTAESLIMAFPNRVSRAVQTAWDNNNLDAKFTIRHAIEPLSDRFKGKNLGRWKYVSCYWDPAEDRQDWFLFLGGHDQCPVKALRWEHVPPDAYGNGPVSDALGDISGLQIIDKSLIGAAELKAGRGAWQGPPMHAASGVLNPFNQAAGTYNPVPGATQITPLVEPRSIQTQDLLWYYEKVEQRINKAMFVDLFLMFLSNDRRQMTATETMERAKEKLLIGPVLHNINSELLNPTIDNITDIIFRESARFWARGEAGMVPMPPAEISGARLKVDYVSELQQSQRLLRAEPVYSLAAFVGQYAALDQTLPMKIDFHQMVDELGTALGVPPKTVRDDETVEAMMQEQAQAQQAAEQQAQEQQQAEMMHKLGNASTEPGTALGDMQREAA